MNEVKVSASAIARILEVQKKPENHEKFLRVEISGGGCNGFQYIFKLDDKAKEGDIEILKQDQKLIVITDEISLPLLQNAEIDFVQELGASYFKVSNPNAASSCGCGSSFSV